VLHSDRLEVRFNSEWLDMSMTELFGLTRTTTVAQLLEREDFAKRFAAGSPISVLELLYPLMQGYDSVAVRADVELGGTDQKFNLLLARDIQRAFGVPEQVVLTMPLITGTDGERKMSKSLGNHIGITESPEEIYGRTLRIPDESLASWYRLLLGREAPPDTGPRDAKRALARSLVAGYHDEAAAQAAQAAFDRVHIRHEAPAEMPEVQLAVGDGVVHLPALLAQAFGVSTSEARRSLAQGAVRLDGEPVASGTLDLPAAELHGRVLQLGKRRFARVRVG
jgi:tyrosyl-tRNA synthetase